jgi:hypothetical protein
MTWRWRPSSSMNTLCCFASRLSPGLMCRFLLSCETCPKLTLERADAQKIATTRSHHCSRLQPAAAPMSMWAFCMAGCGACWTLLLCTSSQPYVPASSVEQGQQRQRQRPVQTVPWNPDTLAAPLAWRAQRPGPGGAAAAHTGTAARAPPCAAPRPAHTEIDCCEQKGGRQQWVPAGLKTIHALCSPLAVGM